MSQLSTISNFMGNRIQHPFFFVTEEGFIFLINGKTLPESMKSMIRVPLWGESDMRRWSKRAGVNFTNILRAAFAHTDLKSAKKDSQVKQLFALSGSLQRKS